ncbi:hypothetical protein PUNSTDRAFT_141784 [Punctularia strigosozonata HHB-11173 SS5]|uniref:uncharacterized protein n=1 Tax=Punctularia strigosozonata (strain HHB-11173) TaxID=741275 RepID=UPI0004417D82|nr:uncharacterized protein PUNSTDRAFT_141784 [Punctularia strigosozonata HHB-11173 SS5]EIN11409.1 hypothetical protein PUNSTDRAFT_141784 [Punctularia strigosozonata HHB-11173 SS5]
MAGTCFGASPFGGPSTPVAPSISTPASSALRRPYKALKPSVTPNVSTSGAKPVGTGLSSVPITTGKIRRVELESVNLSSTGSQQENKPPTTRGRDSYWSASWRKPQQKKHKTWDGDAFIACRNDVFTILSDTGKKLGTAKWKGDPLFSGYRIFAANKEFELDAEIPASKMPAMNGSDGWADEGMLDEEGWETVVTQNPRALSARTSISDNPIVDTVSASTSKKFIPPTSFYGKSAPKPKKGPLHDPEAEGALVMKNPNKEHIKKNNAKDLPIVPVVLDPILAVRLRPHQKEGVKFLYECVMGLRKHEGQGCILADEMGLGKTLQTIALVWTLLKQNPYAGVGPVIGKAMIVCPVSLINNWKNEFHKWLGRDRVGVFVGDKDKAHIKQFINTRIHQVLVIGYEKLRTVIDDLRYCNPPIGLIICDEGHRLKSANNKTSQMFKALNTKRRVILSGTPIQNDLSEFHAMADFCNPGLLDDYKTFKRVYEDPILKSRAVGCTAKEAEIGEARTTQLLNVAKSFVLRRDASILDNYLPPKCEYVVFVTPTRLQLSIFSQILRADKLDDLVEGSVAESLALINMLTRVSTSPVLLKATADQAKSKSIQANSIKRNALYQAVALLPERFKIEDVSLSGKLTALASLLRMIRKHTEEKCIVVSHYTSTLHIIEQFCKVKGYTYLRLDGQTPPTKRQEYVNEFNKTSQSAKFLFLLSAKAGGVGLNLIGASRLCLIDSDWNPSHDLQAMARIHRDGQKRPVFIYRFLTAGTIDEKIYQRQVTKLGLSDSLMGTDTGGSSKSDSFTAKDLRDIFRVHLNTACHTHELLDCPCDREGSSTDREDDNAEYTDEEAESTAEEMSFTLASQIKPGQLNRMEKAYMAKKRAALAALGEWTHINCLKPDAQANVHDDLLRKLVRAAQPEKTVTDSVPAVSAKKSLLDVLDIDNMDAERNEGCADLKNLPGGTVSFLFERVSKDAPPPPADEGETGN